VAAQPAQQLLESAVHYMNTRNLDSAAILLRLVTDVPTYAVSDRVRAWALLGVVDYFRRGDSAAAYALRQALLLDPAMQMPSLESAYPDVARILAGARAEQGGEPARPAPGAVMDCTGRCPEDARAPYFTFFPQLDLTPYIDANAGASFQDRRMRTFLQFVVIIGPDGRIEPESIESRGGSAPNAESAIRAALPAARFSIGRLHGVSTRTKVTLRFDFESEGSRWMHYRFRVTAR
jgi:hypothetical protein